MRLDEARAAEGKGVQLGTGRGIHRIAARSSVAAPPRTGVIAIPGGFDGLDRQVLGRSRMERRGAPSAARIVDDQT